MVKVGDRCTVEGYEPVGTVRFVGLHYEKQKKRVGVEFDGEVDKGRSGTFYKHEYFTGKKGCCLLCLPKVVTVVAAEVVTVDADAAKTDGVGVEVDDRTDGDRTVNNNIADDSCCAKLSPTFLSVEYPVLFAVLNTLIYYADFGTDLRLGIEANQECTAYEDPPTVLPYLIIFVICLHPVSMSAADLFSEGGRGVFGVLLNVTNTRMLYALYKVMTGDSKNTVAAAKSTNDIKLFEAVFESMPQVHLQVLYLLYYPECVGGDTGLIVSLAISTLSIVFALATKFEQLFDKAGQPLFTLATWLYFTSDVISRGLVVAMVFGALGGAGVAAFAGGWVVLDLVWQWLCEWENWGDMEGGKCGVRCCWLYGRCQPLAAVLSVLCLPLVPCCCFKPNDPISVAGPFSGSISIPSTLLSLLTAMPLSTKKRDRTRLFFLSTCFTLAMALCGALIGYPTVQLADTNTSTFRNVSADGIGEAGAAAAASERAADFGETVAQTTEKVSPALAVVFVALAVKSLAYIFGLRSGVLTKGQGTNERAGFSAVFTLSDLTTDQMEFWTRNDWMNYAKENVDIMLGIHIGDAPPFTDTMGANLAMGIKGAGVDCKMVKIDLMYERVGPETGKALADALRTNNTIEIINLGSTGKTGIGPEAGKEFAKALAINNTITGINLNANLLGPEAGKEFAKALAVNNTITEIGLMANNFGPEAGKEFARALLINNTIQQMSLAQNEFDDETKIALERAFKGAHIQL